MGSACETLVYFSSMLAIPPVLTIWVDMDLCCLIDSEDRLPATDLVNMLGDLFARGMFRSVADILNGLSFAAQRRGFTSSPCPMLEYRS